MTNQKRSDELITTEAIQKLHKKIARIGIKSEVNDLAEREPALVGYVICSGHFVSETSRLAGAPQPFQKWIQKEVIVRMLVALGVQRQAHIELWKGLVEDESPPDGADKSGADRKPRVSALAMAKRHSGYATVSWNTADVRQLRPAWSEAEAMNFLQKNQRRLAEMLLEIGRLKLALLIEKHEKGIAG